MRLLTAGFLAVGLIAATASVPLEAGGAPPTGSIGWREITIPAGTALPVVLDTSVGSDISRVEQPVRGPSRPHGSRQWRRRHSRGQRSQRRRDQRATIGQGQWTRVRLDAFLERSRHEATANAIAFRRGPSVAWRPPRKKKTRSRSAHPPSAARSSAVWWAEEKAPRSARQRVVAPARRSS